MHKFFYIFLLILGACSKILVQPTVGVDERISLEKQEVFEVREININSRVVSRENKRVFERRIVYFDYETKTLMEDTLENYMQEKRSALSYNWQYRLGRNDVVKITRPITTIGEIPLADGNDNPFFVSENLKVDLTGYITTQEGRRFYVEGLTIGELKNKLTAEFMQPNKIYGDYFKPVLFPIAKAVSYRLGVADQLQITRLITKVDDETGLSGQVPLVFPVVVEQDGSIQFIELDGRVKVSGMTLQEAQNNLQRELLRSGLSTELKLDVISYNSKSVLVTGDVVNKIVPIKAGHNTVDRLLGNISLVGDDVDYAIFLVRKGNTYQMRVSSIMQEYARDSFTLLDGDKLIIKELMRAPQVAVSIVDFKSQSIFLTSDEDFNDQDPSKNLEGNTRTIFIEEEGVTLFDIVRDYGFWPEEDSDFKIVVTRNGSKYQYSARALTQEKRSDSLFLIHDDLIQVMKPKFSLDKFYIIGETQNTIALSTTPKNREFLMNGLLKSGLFNDKEADIRHIYVLRRRKENNFDAIHFNLSNVLNVSLAEKFEMRPSDIVLVKTQPLYELNRVINALLGLGQVTSTVTNALSSQ